MSAVTTISVGAPHDPNHTPAIYFDGVTPTAQQVTARLNRAENTLNFEADGLSEHWPLDQIRELPDQARRHVMVLQLADDPLKRLHLADPLIESALPHPHKRAPNTKRAPLLAWAVAALASVALIVFFLVPRIADQLAVLIPPAGEKALGDATLEQIRGALAGNSVVPLRMCSNVDGLAALAKLRNRLEESSPTPIDLTVTVLDHRMINAFALPGGHIVFFNGLIQRATTPDQVAAVFAHEIGHVVSRDPTRHALRSAGSIGVLGLLFGDFAGGFLVLTLVEQLIDAQYSQEAERDADSFAYDMLIQAQIRPDALADMFDQFKRSGQPDNRLAQHFQSHPELGDRIAAARDATPEGFEARPLLSDGEWAALQRICR